jgi:hypothetical protein
LAKKKAGSGLNTMSIQQGMAALVWLLGAAAALGASAHWLADAQTGKVSAWALVALAWSAALIALLAHHVGQLVASHAHTLRSFRFRRVPLAGAHLAE